MFIHSSNFGLYCVFIYIFFIKIIICLFKYGQSKATSSFSMAYFPVKPRYIYEASSFMVTMIILYKSFRLYESTEQFYGVNTRVADPGGFYPDPDPTSEEKPDPTSEEKPDSDSTF